MMLQVDDDDDDDAGTPLTQGYQIHLSQHSAACTQLQPSDPCVLPVFCCCFSSKCSNSFGIDLDCLPACYLHGQYYIQVD